MKRLFAADTKKPTIAFLTRNIDDSTGFQLLAGAIEAAQKLNINLVVFNGLQLGKSSANIAYKLCYLEQFDGFLNWATSETENLTYYDIFKGKNLVSLTMQVPEHPVVSFAFYEAMKFALNHLVQVHGVKKIGYFQVPETHVHAQERYQAYVDAHKENGLVLDEKRITLPGDFSPASGVRGVNLLLDERHLSIPEDLDGLVATNDRVAIAAIQELRHRGIRVPQEFAALSSNSAPEGLSFTPPITSIELPFQKQVETALGLLLDMIAGRPVNENISLPCTFLLQRSCGCPSLQIKNVETDANQIRIQALAPQRKLFGFSGGARSKKSFEPAREETAGLVERSLGESVGLKSDAAVQSALARRFVESFWEEIGGKKAGLFLSSLEETLVFFAENGGRVDAWHGAISLLRHQFLKYNTALRLHQRAEELFEKARVAVSEVMNRNLIFARVKFGTWVETLRRIGTKLISTFNLAQLLDVLSRGLRELDIPSYYLCLYDTIGEYRYPDPLPSWSRLVLAYTPHDSFFDPCGKRFPTCEFLPEGVIAPMGRFDLIVLPLIFGKEHLGYAIAEMGPLERNFYTALMDQLATALKGSILIEEREKSQELLESTLAALQSKAQVVSTNSRAIMERVNEVSSATGEMAANERNISQQTEDVLDKVIQAVRIANEAASVIQTLKDQSRRIAQITGMISDIAETTNMLSLNANIQAARAGEAGRGFKVVANEIQNLAQVTVRSTQEIEGIVKTIQKSGEETFSAVSAVIDVISKVSDLSILIKQAVSEQAAAANRVSSSLIETATGSREIFEAINEVARADEAAEAGAHAKAISDPPPRVKEQQERLKK